MSFILINRSLFLFLLFLLFSSCSTKTVYEKIKIKKYEAPIVEVYEDEKINIISESDNELDFEKKLQLKKFKNDNKYFNNVIIDKKKIYAYNKNKLYYFNYNNGDLISYKDLKLTNKNDVLVSFKIYDNSFLLAFKSGLVIRLKINGELIWKYEYDKTLNTELFVFKEQIILLYTDEIKSLMAHNGTEIWSETYPDIPIYQSNGGQVSNFLNLIYFVLPNSSIGAIDLNFGTVHNSKFDELSLVSSINNTKDKIHVYDNYLVYIDEGKYLYTLDIFKNEFILFKKNINLASSYLLFNNSIILKEGNYLQAINPISGKTYWLISDKKISKKSEIIAIREFKKNIQLILSNGDILTIDNKKLVNIKNLDIGEVKDISFENENIIVYTNSNKTIIF